MHACWARVFLKEPFGMRLISDLFLIFALYILMRFLDGMQYSLSGWSLFTLLGLWDPPTR